MSIKEKARTALMILVLILTPWNLLALLLSPTRCVTCDRKMKIREIGAWLQVKYTMLYQCPECVRKKVPISKLKKKLFKL